VSGGELGQSVPVVTALAAQQILDAAVHCADRIGAENRHEFDESEPQLAGRLIAHQPGVAGGLLELLNAIGLPSDGAQLRQVKAQAAAEMAAGLAQSCKEPS
jgi:hypothetical protein